MSPSKLAELTLRTSLGAEYKFPDADEDELKNLIKGLQLGTHLSQLTLTNVSGACLVLPIRIVASVSINGEEKWHR